jgi:hypothetical protein
MKKKKGSTFVPSGLDEVFARICQRRAEAIKKGWIQRAPCDDIIAVDEPEPEKKENEEKEVQR